MFQIAFRFEKLIKRIQPRESEVARAKGHFLRIRRRVSSSFAVSKVLLAGSHGKATAIRSYSDIDVFVVLRREAVRWGNGYVEPETVLRRMRYDLMERYPSTVVRRDRQAVVINFDQGEHAVDVVPAIYQESSETGYPIYLIPDSDFGWLKTSPDMQIRFVNTEQMRSRGKFKRLVQLMKWWAYSRSPRIPISSFHIEMTLAASRVSVGAKSYSMVLADAFDVLAARGGTALRDPLHLQGRIDIANTEASRERVIDALDYAHDHAERATEAEEDHDWREASRQWNIVFNGTFPA